MMVVAVPSRIPGGVWPPNIHPPPQFGSFFPFFRRTARPCDSPAADAEAAVMNGVRGRRCRPIGLDAEREGRRGRSLLQISSMMHVSRLLRHVRPAEQRPSPCRYSASERPDQSISDSARAVSFRLRAGTRDQSAATWCLLSSHQPGSQQGENCSNPRPNIRMTAPETRCVLANACINPSQQVWERGRRDAAAALSCAPQSLSESGGCWKPEHFARKSCRRADV